MVGANLKAETISLMDQRASIEAQMNAIIDRLSQPGGPGITGNLLDPEGFPRPDIDIPAIRSDRRRLAELRSDHKNLTNRIDQNLQVLHSGKLSQNTSSHTRDSGFLPGRPFRHDRRDNRGLPGCTRWVRMGDLVVQVRERNVVMGDELLPRLASEAQSNQGNPVPVGIMRQGSPMTLTVTPRQWHGRGLLGCHFRIL
ncbi:unnamed protein product [Spirodela intermedia]|uniref:Nas2 N-terminal domain-containing protein n=1 Tax=Spirodela intermedia TaxID=51605 RepID=A0A7I8JS51_SPIIN|nr:unnamed protein product [Spirodela intermedia]CAA6672252.1 unnamed protein product [Spirodela intermedia]